MSFEVLIFGFMKVTCIHTHVVRSNANVCFLFWIRYSDNFEYRVRQTSLVCKTADFRQRKGEGADNSSGKVLDYGLYGLGVGGVEIFPSRLVLGFTQPPVK